MGKYRAQLICIQRDPTRLGTHTKKTLTPCRKPQHSLKLGSIYMILYDFICEFYIILRIIWNMTSRNTDETIPWFWFQWFNPFVAQGSSKSTWLGSFCASIAWTFRSAALELWRCCWRCGRFWWAGSHREVRTKNGDFTLRWLRLLWLWFFGLAKPSV